MAANSEGESGDLEYHLYTKHRESEKCTGRDIYVYGHRCGLGHGRDMQNEEDGVHRERGRRGNVCG